MAISCLDWIVRAWEQKAEPQGAAEGSLGFSGRWGKAGRQSQQSEHWTQGHGLPSEGACKLPTDPVGHEKCRGLWAAWAGHSGAES